MTFILLLYRLLIFREQLHLVINTFSGKVMEEVFTILIYVFDR